MANDKPENDKRRASILAWAGVTGVLMAQGALVRGMGGPAAAGFQTGAPGLLRSAFRSAPLPVKAASLAVIAAGALAKMPLHGTENVLSEISDYRKK